MADKTNKTFADEMAELEAITTWFEGSDIDLDEALTKFERGMELAADLKKQLASVENKIEKIKKSFDEPAAAAPATEDDVNDDQPPVEARQSDGLF